MVTRWCVIYARRREHVWCQSSFLPPKMKLPIASPDFVPASTPTVTKPFEPEELIAVVKSILDRVQRTHSDLARMFGDQHEIAAAELVRDEDLTDAEWRVAEAVARGLSNKEIAAELKLSLRTIEGHISRILDKKNLSNRV